MAELHQSIDPKSGFCPKSKTFHSLRPHVPLPPEHLPISASEFAFSLLIRSETPKTTAAIIDAATGTSVSYAELTRRVETLAFAVRTQIGLSRGDTAFILSPPCIQIPILYLSLLSIGVIISPANPTSTDPEVSRQMSLTKPAVAFVSAATAGKVQNGCRKVLVDSGEFRSMMETGRTGGGVLNRAVKQGDTAAILYSSGTTGRIKGVELSHRNFIAVLAGYGEIKAERGAEAPHPVALFTVPLFHVFGFFMCLRGIAMGETLVLMERFDLVGMLKAIERYRVTYMPVSPPLVVAMAKLDVVKKFDLSSLELVGCGGAPLGKEVSERFTSRFPHIEITQGYGMTETTGGASRMIGPSETIALGSTGRLGENTEAKIVDPATGEALGPGRRGELWLRGPIIMKGYVGDEEATAATLDSEGWLKTGDLCYIDSNGFLYIVERLKELIKYKAYQVPPAELEQLLQSHPEIADSAVIPYPDEDAGQIPMGFIVRKPGSKLNEAQVAPYKKLRRVAFINSIPKSPSGKILRRELVDAAVHGSLSKL
ncbi:hypothetical protein Syun_024440 [Stephania yunnanensis]|uniref:4-coumarate--CoA ligase n=1 Tax=Stephania yunnanensis TaxID=152371 RepID=A0AAP0NIN2_9MAGN